MFGKIFLVERFKFISIVPGSGHRIQYTLSEFAEGVKHATGCDGFATHCYLKVARSEVVPYRGGVGRCSPVEAAQPPSRGAEAEEARRLMQRSS